MIMRVPKQTDGLKEDSSLDDSSFHPDTDEYDDDDIDDSSYNVPASTPVQTTVSSGRPRRTKSQIKKLEIRNRAVVDHTYHDHFRDPFVKCMDTPSRGKHDSGCKKLARGGVATPFPEKLHEMLAAAENLGFENVISWQVHGRAFLIHDKKNFVQSVMPRFFSQTKLTSFQRQLNLYGFVRLTQGPDRGSYYHELFLRGRPDLCLRMTRTRIKGNGMKAAASPNTEPNFYAMEHCCDDRSSTKMERNEIISIETPNEEQVRPPKAKTSRSRAQAISKPSIVTPTSSASVCSKPVDPTWPEALFLPLDHSDRLQDEISSGREIRGSDKGVVKDELSTGFGSMPLTSILSPSLLTGAALQKKEEQAGWGLLFEDDDSDTSSSLPTGDFVNFEDPELLFLDWTEI